MVAGRRLVARGAVRADPRPAAAARRLDRSRVRRRVVRLRHVLAVHLPACVRLGAGVADAHIAGRADRNDVPVLRGAVLPGKPVLAQARRDARLAGPAGAVGAARMAARLVSERLPVAVAGLCDDRFAARGLGAVVRSLRRVVGRGRHCGRAQCAADTRRCEVAADPGVRRRRNSGFSVRTASASRLDADRRTSLHRSGGAGRRVARPEMAGEEHCRNHDALFPAHRASVGCPPDCLAGSRIAGAGQSDSRLLEAAAGGRPRARRRFCHRSREL